jgi:membrane fusion protein, multidrug efflux system
VKQLSIDLAAVVATAMLAAAGCRGDDTAKASTGAPPPIQVGVITLAPQVVTLTKELPGRTSAFRVAEVRARVNGIVQKRLFTEGADVTENQPLFRIDPGPYQAALESASAQLARAEAMVESARSLADRYATLIESNAISRQENDDAKVRVKTSQADVAAARAAVKTARINLDYTAVTAPVAGRIGRAEVTEGAYVQAQSATLLATVQQIDKLYVDMTWSSAEVMRLRAALASGKLKSHDGAASVTLVLDDGRAYDTPGTLQFTDASVDQTTGSISLRAIVPNPRRELLPGMFVRARIDEGTDPAAILVPQRAVTRDQSGRPVALVVDAAGKVERRMLETDRAIGDAWLVTKGVAAGDRVIVEGLQRVRPGAQVIAVPAASSRDAKQAATPRAAEAGPAPAAAPPPPPAPAAKPAAAAAPPAPPASPAPAAAGSAK